MLFGNVRGHCTRQVLSDLGLAVSVGGSPYSQRSERMLQGEEAVGEKAQKHEAGQLPALQEEQGLGNI